MTGISKEQSMKAGINNFVSNRKKMTHCSLLLVNLIPCSYTKYLLVNFVHGLI